MKAPRTLALHRRLGLALAAAAVLGGCTMTQPALQETRELELSIAPDGLLSINAGAGSMALEGEPGSEAIRVTAEIYQVEPNDHYTLRLETTEDGSARLVAIAGDRRAPGSDRIDLSIRVPDSLRIDVNDGSGSLRIENLRARLEIEDGSGSMDISGIDADVVVDDGSGSIRLVDIGGSVEIEDGSGSMTIERVAGDLAIDDGAGSITARDIGGTVSVDDGSGSINVHDAGDFELIDDGSGSVNLDNIRSRD